MFTGLDEELDFVLKLFQKHYEIKQEGRFGSGPNDVKEIYILGRTVRLHDWGLSWEAGSRRQQMVMEYFGLKGVEGSQQEGAQGGGHSGGGAREAQARRAKELQSSGR